MFIINEIIKNDMIVNPRIRIKYINGFSINNCHFSVDTVTQIVCN